MYISVYKKISVYNKFIGTQTFAVITSLYIVVLTRNKDHSTHRNLPNPTMCDTIANHKLYKLYH